MDQFTVLINQRQDLIEEMDYTEDRALNQKTVKTRTLCHTYQEHFNFQRV
jgi:hypothetical protein